jgi:hypothetical protein
MFEGEEGGFQFHTQPHEQLYRGPDRRVWRQRNEREQLRVHGGEIGVVTRIEHQDQYRTKTRVVTAARLESAATEILILARTPDDLHALLKFAPNSDIEAAFAHFGLGLTLDVFRKWVHSPLPAVPAHNTGYVRVVVSDMVVVAAANQQDRNNDVGKVYCGAKNDPPHGRQFGTNAQCLASGVTSGFRI